MPTDLRFALCIYEQTVAARPRRHAALQAGRRAPARASRGFIFRAQSANDYYVVRADALDNSVRLYRMEKGKRRPDRRQGGRRSRAASWHSLRVIADRRPLRGLRWTARSLFSATDRSLPQAGPMGVWSQADSLTLFGSLLVNPPAR